jgi:hypothetical protein
VASGALASIEVTLGGGTRILDPHRSLESVEADVRLDHDYFCQRLFLGRGKF